MLQHGSSCTGSNSWGFLRPVACLMSLAAFALLLNAGSVVLCGAVACHILQLMLDE
jgi:hypothetical protein